jgi:hypothetical protein
MLWKKELPDRPAALENFRRDLAKAINTARYSQVDPRMLADILIANSNGLRRGFAATARVGAAL